MKRLLLIQMMVFLIIKTFASEYLVLNHVMYWGWEEPGHIESASLLVEPKGIFAECTMIIDFIDGGVSQDDYDSLEIDMNFRLPSESHITDLSLWIDNEEVKGVMFDKWTASLIYESIVERRIDPAILTKISADEYNIKIFPILNNLPRRIKIVYMVSVNDLLTGNPKVYTPFNILKLSATSPDFFKLAFKGNSSFHSPEVSENTDVTFHNTDDPDFGNCEVAVINNPESYSSLSLTFHETNDSQLQIHTLSDEVTDEDYFELSLRHSSIFDISKHRKVVFMLDFIDENCSVFTGEAILNMLKYKIENSYSEADSFNILVSGLETYFLSEEWISADAENINEILADLDTSLFNSYSNLPTLLADGIDFLKNRGGEGSMVLISSSNSDGSAAEANALITDYLYSLQGLDIPIHIIDLDDMYYNYNDMHYIGGQYFRGNEYFYGRLSQLTVGEYYSLRSQSFNSMLDNVNSRTAGYFKSLGIFIQSEDGYAFAEYEIKGTGSLIYNDESYNIVGKYVGEPPFYVNVYGQDESNIVYHITDTIQSGELNPADSILRKVWTSQMLKDLYDLEQSTQIVNQIINTSIEEKILTTYTALLVLEPDFEIPDDLEDDEWIEPNIPETVYKETKNDHKISMYPNPCTESSTISYTVPYPSEVSLIIYNSMGQPVTKIVEGFVDAGEYTFLLDASGLAKGMYFCCLILDGKYITKLKFIVA